VLALPGSFMNESGETVRKLIQHFETDPASDLLVVIDDVSLPFGKLRIRSQGSDGGHRGLRSVETHLGSQNYARLRVGIAPSAEIGVPLEEYVLSPFTSQEEKKLSGFLGEAGEACLLWLTQPMEKVMNKVNKSNS